MKQHGYISTGDTSEQVSPHLQYLNTMVREIADSDILNEVAAGDPNLRYTYGDLKRDVEAEIQTQTPHSTTSSRRSSQGSVNGDGFFKSLIDPGCDRGYGAVLVIVAVAQLVGRELGLSARVLGIIGAVMHVVSMAVPIVHGAFVVRESSKELGGVGKALKSNWAVVVCMVPMLAAVRDFVSMRGTEVQIGGKLMAVGGHGVLALMAAAMVCAQGLCSGGRKMDVAQLVMFAAGDVVVVSGYVVRWLAPDAGERYHVVPLAYAVLGILLVVAALVGKRMVGKSEVKNARGWQKAASVGLPLVSAVLVCAGCVDTSAHSMGYVEKMAKVAGALVA